MDKPRRQQALQHQIQRLGSRLEDLERLSNRFSWVRLGIFVGGFALSIAAFALSGPPLAGVILGLTAVVFGLTVFFHRQIEESQARHQIWRMIQETQVARQALDWDHLPPPIGRAEQPLERDLDLVGKRSLHRLLDTSVTQGGGRRLREWLARPEGEPDQIRRRQALVQELAARPLFRNRLILQGKTGGGEDTRWSGDELSGWLTGHLLSPALRTWLILLAGLATTNIVLFALQAAGLLPALWQFTFLIYAILFLARHRQLGEPFQEAMKLRDNLETLAAVFNYLERFGYARAPGLAALCAPFRDPTQRPSGYLRRINQTLGGIGARGNPALWLVLNALLPWDYYFALKLNDHKRDLAGRLPGWLDIWFELEALSSLANLAYLNPHFTFPDILPAGTGVETGTEILFQAQGLGHPLLPDREKICNNFQVEHLGELNLITGSNMSGKSTFLRTVGVNLVLAYAGGPVDAQSLQTIPFRLYSCVRVSDSVTDGISYFYAEVKCLKRLLDDLTAAEDGTAQRPLFYFVDEIFRGTNNRERLTGSRAFLHALAGRRGVGLISTHDLELIGLEDEIPLLRNFHFRDDVADGRMTFDYTLRPGPSPTTNALKIMELEGLPV